MNETSLKLGVTVAAGAVAAAFLGYCIYFDHKRRSDPDFKKKLKEKRMKAKASKPSTGKTQFPNLRDPEAMQKFFLQEIQHGEELLGSGDLEAGVDHLANAVAVCGQPNQLLGVLNQSLPPAVFQLLLAKLPEVQKELQQFVMGVVEPRSQTTTKVMEDLDVE